MKIVSYNIETEIDFAKCDVYDLVLENSNMYYDVTNKLIKMSNGEEQNDIVLSDNNQEISLGKIGEIIYNFYDLDINNKKIQGLVFKHLIEIAKENDFYVELANINQSLMDFYTKLLTSQELNVCCDTDISLDNIIKLGNFKFEESNKLIEKLVDYIDVLNKLKPLNIIILIDAFSVLSLDEIEKFIKQMKYLNLKILFVNPFIKYDITNAKRIIVDQDLCEI